MPTYDKISSIFAAFSAFILTCFGVQRYIFFWYFQKIYAFLAIFAKRLPVMGFQKGTKTLTL